ncbi:MAG: ABC transporter ATP-binding protein [Candidatus Atribacteria bacterium]|nr:ABC transporter ATP-binding protein [Candidatus Atribacteria bacterium]
MAQIILKVDGVCKNFGGLSAVSEYQLALPEGKIFGLIGPNGAGKTTLFNLISGVIKPTKGHIFLKGTDITSWRPDQIAAMGLTRTFQNLRLFSSLTVEMNLKVAHHLHIDYRLTSALLNFPSLFQKEKQLQKKVDEILDVFVMSQYRQELTGNLPYGLQRKLDIARALMTEPEVILLDEPSSGMNTREAEDLAHLIGQLQIQFQLTLMVVEHRMAFVMGLAEVIQVLDYGSVLAQGSPEEVRNNPQVIEAYLGTGDSVA